MSPYVKTTILENHIAEIEFFHPLSNSLPSELLKQLKEQILKAGHAEAVNVIVLRSAGERAFCGGASFEELMSIKDEESGKQFFSGFAGVINAIRTCSKIVIARIHGKAVGGGVGIAAAADVALATAQASIRLSELAVGIGPFVIGPAVERKIGNSGFSWMSLTPDVWQSAEWAERKGLFNQVFESTEALDEFLSLLTHKMSQYNPTALQELKKVFWQGTDHWDRLLQDRAAISGELVLSEFTSNAIEAFKQK
jgi:methylglutaconyl-CoA hydratase